MSIVSSDLQVPIFHPTLEEFQDFSSYISKIESCQAHRIGLAKIVPPKEWRARKMGYKQRQIEETMVQNPIKQEVHGKSGFYSVYNIQQRSMKMSQFQKLTTTHRYATPTSIATDVGKLEKKYWDNLTSISPIYGADVSGSFYDENQKVWNVNNLGTILDDLGSEYGTKIEGVNTAYLYFGMWKATFAWHTEDMDLYSINYLHFGAPKQWYVIPPSSSKRFENFAASHFPALARRCPAFLRHKMTLIAPSILTKHSIPYSKVTQYENEFIITFPYAYHSGFNYGFNCAESTNFALQRWIEYGKHSIQCACRHDMVKIRMDRFVLKYQPHLYDDWYRGMNLTPHPEDNQGLENPPPLVRSSPTKKRLPMANHPSKNSSDVLLTSRQLQASHHERISNERYSCIFRNLVKFDEQKHLQICEYPSPLIRAALYRVQSECNENVPKLSSLTARLVFHGSSLPNPILFNGLEQSRQYCETLLEGLWNHQVGNERSERMFNQWLAQRKSRCSICYLFNANKCEPDTSNSSHLRFISNPSNDFLQCADCCVCVHRECYENLYLALDVQINEEYDRWYCQRCTRKRQSTSQPFHDHCSACFLRGGLLLFDPNCSSSFIHGVCSIVQAHQSPSPSSSRQSCYYCWSFCPLNHRRISTHCFVSCHQSKCKHRFHVTCGLVNGCTFQMTHGSSVINARCHLHAIPHQSSTNIVHQKLSAPDNRNADDDERTEYLDNSIDDDDGEVVAEDARVPIGTRVILNEKSKHKTGRVIGSDIFVHYAVDFGDGSYSHDMLAEDILDDEPSTLVIGSRMRIKWTDGSIYSCRYLGRKCVLLYQIQLENETRQMRRSEFSYDMRPAFTPSQAELEHNYSRRQLLPSTGRKRRHQRKQQIKRKRQRVVLSSSSCQM